MKYANDIGLTIPNTLITGNKKELKKFIDRYGEIITKNAAEGLTLETKDAIFYGYTELLDDKMYNKLNDSFYPSLFQQKIHKIFEVRSFFIDNEVYSMCIFSQTNDNTNLDFRHYDLLKPNRNVPFKLPFEVENKAKQLMKFLKINCCSIDFIYSLDKQFYFLELNPVGQFGMVSFPCNYYLEQNIAEKLKNETK